MTGSFGGITRPTAMLIKLVEHQRLVRVKPARPLTPTECIVVSLLAFGENCVEVAVRLGVSKRTVKFHVKNAAQKLPGDLPAQMRVITWYRGATADVLTGDPMKGNFAPPIDGRVGEAAVPLSTGRSWPAEPMRPFSAQAASTIPKPARTR